MLVATVYLYARDKVRHKHAESTRRINPRHVFLVVASETNFRILAQTTNEHELGHVSRTRLGGGKSLHIPCMREIYSSHEFRLTRVATEAMPALRVNENMTLQLLRGITVKQQN